MTKKIFDFDDALKAIQSGQSITGADGVLAPLVKQLTEAALSAELDTYLADNPTPGNRRNGYSKKTLKSSAGRFELETPRDRHSDFEPQLVKKNQTQLSEEIDSKIISLYSHGMSYRDIKTHITSQTSMASRCLTALSPTSLTSWCLSSKRGSNARWMRFTRSFGWTLSTIKSKTKDVTSTKPCTRF